MKITNKRKRFLLWAALFLWIAIWTLGGIQIVKAATLFQAADNSGAGTNQSWNRAFVCSAETELCYAFGGGTTAGTTVDDTYFYTPGTDTWTTTGFAEMPAAYRFIYYAGGAYENWIFATETSSGNQNTLLYGINGDSWSTIADPAGGFSSSTITGTNVDSEYYVFNFSGTILTAYTLDIESPGSGWSSAQSAVTASTSVQYAKSVYDPVNQTIVIITRDNGITFEWDVAAGTGIVVADTFTPCTGAGTVCIPSVFFYDADLGLVAGKQGDPGATTIGLYQYDPVTNVWGNTPVETLTDSDFNYLAFTDFAPKGSAYTNPNTGVTEFMFGGGVTNLANPGVASSEWFIRTGDPGGVATEDRNFDTWYQNFLDSMGMGGTLGKLLVSSMIGGIFYFVLAIKGVPWIISLGITGLIITTFTAGLIFNPAILLGLIAIVGLGGMFLLLAMIFGGGDSA